MKSLRSLLILAVSTQSLVKGNLRGNDISNESLEGIRRLEQEKKTLKTYKHEAMKFLIPDKANVSIDRIFGSVGVNIDLDRMFTNSNIIKIQPDEP